MQLLKKASGWDVEMNEKKYLQGKVRKNIIGMNTLIPESAGDTTANIRDFPPNSGACLSSFFLFTSFFQLYNSDEELQMKSLAKDAFRISTIRPAGSLTRVGRCHYHSNNLPIIKTIDDETLVKVSAGIGSQVEIRYANCSPRL